jgi:hypothetical protein
MRRLGHHNLFYSEGMHNIKVGRNYSMTGLKKLHPASYTPKYWCKVNKHLDPTHIRPIVTARGPLVEQQRIV